VKPTDQFLGGLTAPAPQVNIIPTYGQHRGPGRFHERMSNR
jgi:hypothetical protein